MIVFHGSNIVVVHPDVTYSRKTTDFSKGFYVTTIKEQAEMWAIRKSFGYKESFINKYVLNEEELNKLKVLEFSSYSSEWLSFVSRCRTGIDETNYDVVIGPIADDKVFDTLELYFSNLISAEEAIKKIEFVKPNVQICIRNNESINKLLKYKSTEAI